MKKTRTIVIKEDSSRRIELTVNPKSLTIKDSVGNTRKNVDRLGEVNLPGRRGLKEVSINTFLPHRKSPFYDGESISGDLDLIDYWKENGTKVRVIISDPQVNFTALIDSDSMTLAEGRKDVLIDWTFSEYKEIDVPTVDVVKGLFETEDPSLNNRSEENAPKTGGTEVVKNGTTLWALAVKYYGDGNQWKKISAANGNINPKKLQKGMTLTIPA